MRIGSRLPAFLQQKPARLQILLKDHAVDVRISQFFHAEFPFVRRDGKRPEPAPVPPAVPKRLNPPRRQHFSLTSGHQNDVVLQVVQVELIVLLVIDQIDLIALRARSVAEVDPEVIRVVGDIIDDILDVGEPIG